jgi:hypothetical protein
MKTIPSPRKRSIRAKKVNAAASPDFVREEDRQLFAHPTDEELEEFLLGRITEEQRRTIDTHLGDCNACWEHLIDLAAFIEILLMAKSSNGASDNLDPPHLGKAAVSDRTGAFQ